jgi:hypothetical protein
MAGILESRLIISAQDKTGVVIDALAAKIEALEKKIAAFDRASAGADKALGRSMTGASRGALDAVGKVEKLGRSVDAAARHASGIDRLSRAFEAMGRAATQASVAAKAVGNNIAPFAAGAAGFGIKAFKAGATTQDQVIAMKMAGIPAQDIAAYQAQSLDLSKKYPMVSAPDIMHLQKEVRSVLTHKEEVPHVIEPLVQAKAVLDAIDSSHQASEGLPLLVKGAENIGATNPERFNKLLDGYVRAIQVMGKTINPEQIYEFNKYSKLAGANLSDRFLMTTGLSLSQEMGGSSAGNAIGQGYKRMVGGLQNLHTAAKEFARLGLIDENNLDYTKTGEVKGIKAGVRHAVKGDSLFATDPDRWTYEVLQPALAKAGITSQEDQLALLPKLFNSTTADLIGKLIVQRVAFENKAKQYGDATGIEKGAQILAESASAQLLGVSESLKTFIGQAADPLMTTAAENLGRVSAGLHALTDDAKANPSHGSAEIGAGLVAGGAGALVAGNAALKWLGWRGVATGGAAVGEGVAAGEGAAALGGVAGGALPILATAGLGLGLVAGTIYALDNFGPKGNPRNAGRHGPGAPHGPGRWVRNGRSMNFVADPETSPDVPLLPPPPPPPDFIGSSWPIRAARPPDPPGTWPHEGQASHEAQRIEVNAAVSGEANVNSSVTVTGETTIKLDVQVSPSPDLISKITESTASAAQLRQIAAQTERARVPLRSDQVAVNASGPGSTGKSMPDQNSFSSPGRFGRN